jgi:hypothetical protein
MEGKRREGRRKEGKATDRQGMTVRKRKDATHADANGLRWAQSCLEIHKNKRVLF